MKRRILKMFLILVVLGAARLAIALYDTGYGSQLTATTVTGRMSGFTANMVSVYNNNSTNDFFFLLNCSTNTFNTRLAAGTTIRVAPASGITLNAGGQDSIESICYATTNLTASFDVATY